MAQGQMLNPHEEYDFNAMCRSCLKYCIDLNPIFDSDLNIANESAANTEPLKSTNDENNSLYLALIASSQTEVNIC